MASLAAWGPAQWKCSLSVSSSLSAPPCLALTHVLTALASAVTQGSVGAWSGAEPG